MSHLVRRTERLALVAIAGLACSYPIEPAAFERYEPLSVYSVWYTEVQSCAAVEGPPLGEMEFWRVPGARQVTVRDTSFTAYFEAPNTIVVAGFYTTSRPAVTHELLHAILLDDPYHESPLWQTCMSPSASL